MDRNEHGDDSIKQRRDELIHATEDRSLREKVFHCAYQLTRNKLDAEDYSQEALTRYISAVKNKNSLKEMEGMGLPYIYMIVRNIHRDMLKKMCSNASQKSVQDQRQQSQKEADEKLGRQKFTLLATQLGMSVEDIADLQLEKGQIEPTKLGVEEQVVSVSIVEEFINSLPEELSELARLLIFGEYKLKELTKMLKQSLEELQHRKRRIREAFSRFQENQIRLEKAKSSHGR